MIRSIVRRRPFTSERRSSRAAAILAAAIGIAGPPGMTASAFAAGQPRIVSPEVDDTVHSNEGVLNVVVADGPQGARAQALLDGAPFGETKLAPAFELQGVDRGEHSLVVRFFDSDGRFVVETPPVKFVVWQASRLNPGGAR